MKKEFFIKYLAKELGVESQCIWYGAVSHEKVQLLMQESDLLFFTSVAEGTPHVVLEAIANNLPSQRHFLPIPFSM